MKVNVPPCLAEGKGRRVSYLLSMYDRTIFPPDSNAPMTGEFTLNNRLIQTWLALLAVAEVGLVILRPPSMWLCVLAMGLLVLATTANSIRVWRGKSEARGRRLNWFEGWAAASAMVCFAVPILAILLRWGMGA